MEESHSFIDTKTARALAEQFGTPIYVYDEKTLRENAEKCLAFPHEFGLKVRFAIKACPTAAVLKLFNSMGLYFDASSVFEVYRAMRAGVPAEKISLSTQELPLDFEKVIKLGIQFNACSLDQLERFGRAFTACVLILAKVAAALAKRTSAVPILHLEFGMNTRALFTRWRKNTV